MGLRGPPPKPSILKFLPGGDPGRRGVHPDEPIPPAGMPAPPEPLNPRAKKIWDAIVPDLAKAGLARIIDGNALARYCIMFPIWFDAAKTLEENGSKYVVRGEPSKGKPGRVLSIRLNPDFAVLSRLHRDLLVIEREFGQTPAARTRIRVQAEGAAKGDVDELKRNFFAGGTGA